jgi:predicted ATP-binding protein involved in virulence
MKKLSIYFHSWGSHNDNLMRLVSHNNDGKAEVPLEMIKGYLDVQNALYPLTENITTTFSDNTLHVHESGKPTVSISIKEIHELQPNAVEISETVFK